MNIEDREIVVEDARPVFEDVESRTLMSVASLEGHQLAIITEDGNDVIDLQMNEDASELTATVNGQTSEVFPANKINEIYINAGNGNNRITLDSRIGATTGIYTGSGRDIVYGGLGNDYISTGGGRDIIDGRAGNDTILGGSGNDKINAGSGNDVVNAGSGNDSISADGGIDKLMGRKGNDKFYADADDYVQADGGKNVVYRSATTMTRDDGYEGPRVNSVSIVDADSGKVVDGYENITGDIVIDPSAMPAHYTVIANVGDDAKSVGFNVVGMTQFRRDSGGTFSLTDDAGANKFKPWQPAAGGKYTLQVQANTAEQQRGITGDLFQIGIAVKKVATGAGGDVTPTPSDGVTPVPTPTPTPTPSADPAAPKIKLKVLIENPVAGQAFHAEATGTTIPGYQAEDAKFEWDFGDPAGKFNKMPGFNAAHVYEKAGTYTATLTVTAPGGKVSKVTQVVEVKTATYKTIYVAANGNDSREGATQDQAVKTLGRAVQLAGDNTKILMRRGDTFGVVGTAAIEDDNVVIDTYGVGASPIIKYEGPRSLATLIRVNSTASDVMINGLTFTSIYDKDTEQSGMCLAIQTAGHNITIRGNTFLHVGYAINNNGNPDCLYVVSNDAPLDNGVRGYFCWTQGTNLVVVGNHVANSTREHGIRAAIFTNLTVAFNDVTNLDRRPLGDASDFSKGTINIQRGDFAYVADNVVHDGDLSVGPLGGGDGVGQKDGRTRHVVLEDNDVHDSRIAVQHGMIGATIRDNTIAFNGDTQILVRGWDEVYGRGAEDIVIDHNVGINTATIGRFLEVNSHADGIVLTNNVYVAPNLAPGGWATGPINLFENNLSSFKTINGNLWPTGNHRTTRVVDGLISIAGNYVSAATWNAFTNVGTDRVEDVLASDALKLTLTPSMLKAA